MSNIAEIPLSHLSFSSMRTLSSNAQIFKKRYILNIRDGKQSPSGLVGKAFHLALENYYSGMSYDDASKIGYDYISNYSDDAVDWKKTGSKKKSIAELGRVLDFYKVEEPEFRNIIDTEKVITANVELPSGLQTPIPLKGVIDLVEGDIRTGYSTIDFKTVSSFTDKTEDEPAYIVQGAMYYLLAKTAYGEAPEKHTFVEVKKSKNRDGDNQIEFYELDYNKHRHYLKLLEKLYVGVITQLSNPDFQYLPNFDDLYDGKEAWQDFTLETMDFKMPEKISHSTTIDRFAENRKKFVESEVDLADNENMKDWQKVESKLLEFGIRVSHDNTYEAPNVTLHTFKPNRGLKMNKITQHEKDLAQALEATSLRVLAPIPGSSKIGIEVGNRENGKIDWSKDLLTDGTIEIPVGVNVYGDAYKINLAKAPHLLIAGATGSGKSVFMKSAITTLTQQNATADLSIILIDPKQVEFAKFKDVPHLFTNPITENDEALATLQYLVGEMEARYSKFQREGVTNIDEYKEKYFMSKYVVFIDELADLLMGEHGGEINDLLIRLAQKSRASGIHLVVGTQRPSVDVVTGVLKANMPTRIAFRVATRADSMVILDQKGAEQLLGYGDCLLMTDKERSLVRLQSYFL